jgi:hypothetical protein
MGLDVLSTGHDHGSKSTRANSHLKKFKVMGGTMSATTAPSTLLPAQTSGGSSSKPAVAKSRLGLGGAEAVSDMTRTLTELRGQSLFEAWRMTSLFTTQHTTQHTTQ